jgi:hypothetical protein
MRGTITLLLVLAATLAQAGKVVLVPLDSRPAAGQFAQMIAAMAAVEVRMPPYELLGRFTSPGSSDRILDWLEGLDLSDTDSVVVSTDMIAYGGLIESRLATVPQEKARERLLRLRAIRNKWPETRFYGFSAIMRLAPTSTRSNASWREALTRYVEVRDRHAKTKQASLETTMQNLLARIPAAELQRYEAARARNHQIQRALLHLTVQGMFDYLILGQDDAQPHGPHVDERTKLQEMVDKLAIGGRVYFCEGIDQHSNILVSRALLRQNDWVPRIRIVYSDEAAKRAYASYESKPVEHSLRDQILASGARPAINEEEYDYTLFLNAPDRRRDPFLNFLQSLGMEVDQGFPVTVADINLGKTGTADQALFTALWEEQRMMRLLAYAGWNTAGNTMGTAIPAANVFLLARRLRTDALQSQLAQQEFLLHRFVNDYAYHRSTRPEAYRIIDSSPNASREETHGVDFLVLNDFVRRDMEKHLDRYFREQFFGRKFFAGTRQYVIDGIRDVRIFLPWPRAYEVRLEFRLTASPLEVE